MSNSWLTVVAALTGAAVMVLELMAVRLMAPWFGQSQPVWTNVIGVVLAALAAGQWLGGRWAESARGPRPALLLFLAGAWSLALPDIVGALGAAVVPSELPLLEAYPFVTWGSLLVSLVSLGFPLVALGAMTPGLVRLSPDAQRLPGKVAGRLLGAGTIGSLIGTFGATHLLLSTVGSAWAVRVAGALLLGIALLVQRVARSQGGKGRVLLLLLPAAAAFLPASRATDGTVLEVRETPYQLAQVVEMEDGVRALRLNEGLDSFHSLYDPNSFWSGTYFDAFLAPALAAPKGAGGERDVLIIGLAAGTMARQLLRVDPGARVRGVEIDAEIVELGRRWFDLPAGVDTVEGVDGRVALGSDAGRYGAILMDAYAQQVYLPAHLCTQEFFQSVFDHLLEGGVAALNIGGTGREDPVVNAVAGTFASVFEESVLGRVPGTRNMLLMGSRGGSLTREALRAAVQPTALPALDGGGIGLDWLWDSQAMGRVDPAHDGPLLDGAAPVEALAHASWKGQSLRSPSTLELQAGEDALLRAAGLMAQTRWSEVESLLTAMLPEASGERAARAHLLLGNIAFERGQWELAVHEYDAAGNGADLSPAQRQIADTAGANAQLAQPSIDRRMRLASALTLIQWSVGGVLLLSLAALVQVYRSLGRSPQSA